MEGGEKRTTLYVAHQGRRDHLRRNVGVVHKTVGMRRRQFHHLPRHSAFGFRWSGDAGGGGGAISWLPRVQKVPATASSESAHVTLAKL